MITCLLYTSSEQVYEEQKHIQEDSGYMSERRIYAPVSYTHLILLDRKGKRLAARVQAVKSFLKFFV